MKRDVNSFKKTVKAWFSDMPSPKSFIKLTEMIQQFQSMHEELL